MTSTTNATMFEEIAILDEDDDDDDDNVDTDDDKNLEKNVRKLGKINVRGRVAEIRWKTRR
jgi:hypothetical protein